MCVEVAVLVVSQLELGSTGDGGTTQCHRRDHTEGLCLMAAPAMRAAGGTELLQLGTGCVAAPGEMGLCG